MADYIGKKHAGFELIDVEDIQEIKSIAFTWVHTETRLKLLYLRNDDDNKVFLIGFKTPPEDSTGLPHILEHAVLCGSDKFPLKDPFQEMSKGSMNTFINAMTFPDKTLYPVASQNVKDFKNLMDVYMDAVLHPKMRYEKKIFQQEGWHYEILRKEDPITIQGIVYNEMKGHYSTPESILESNLLPSLYPSTPYRYDSGGNPDDIPTLTYEKFVEFHKKYYHPSNGFIILYGNGDMEDHLSFLQENYLQQYTYQPIDASITKEDPFQERKMVTYSYPAQDDGEDPDDKNYLSLHYALPSIQDPKTHIAWDVLSYILLESPAAPLKQALLDAGLGKDILGNADKSLLQPVFSIISKQVSLMDKERFVQVVEDTLAGYVRNGLDKKLVESSLNHMEFHIKEADYHGFPKGLAYILLMIMDSWVYDLKPTLHLAYQKGLDELKESLRTPLFEKMIQKQLLENRHSIFMVGIPNTKINEEKEIHLEKEMDAFKASLSDAALEALIQESNALKDFQSEEDSDEIKMTIPQLALQDISRDALWYPQTREKRDHVTYFLHPIETNGIAYLKILFPANGLEFDQIPFISFLSEFMAEINTTKHHYDVLNQEIDLHTGGIDLSPDIISRFDDDTQFTPYLSLQTKFFPRYTEQTFSLLDEIMTQTVWNQPKRMKELLQQACSRFEMNLYWLGSRYAMRRASHYFSPVNNILEQLDGIGYYLWAKHWLERFDKDFELLMQSLDKVLKTLLNQADRIVSVTVDPDKMDSLKNHVLHLNQSWKINEFQSQKWSFPSEPIQEGIQSGSRVQYVAKGYNFRRNQVDYHGSFAVMDNLLSSDYLYKMIRIKGGAYGAQSQINRNGNLLFCSYRDPHLSETLEVYKNAAAFLAHFNGNQRVINSYIIGTISMLDHPLTPSQQGDRAMRYALSGIQHDFLNLEREQVLSTTLQDIHHFSPVLADCMKMPYTCVLGNDKRIEAEKGLFNRLTKLMI